jgi:alkanesulfonate monooxygenase SsuD/methylene tetrahydromethanopterin reductase-like flavin-dependent oxidoreductase (luciferase family)
MDVYFFSELPYVDFDQEEADKYPSRRLKLPNTLFDPAKASDRLKQYLDQYQYADEMGFDGVMTNEHHGTPTCMNIQTNIIAGILARTTSRAKILMLGNLLPMTENPVRLAEEIALLDLISGGRIISGVVRGIGPENWAANSNPVYNRERFYECHDLLIKAWTEPGPFRWEGKHYHFRVVNPWVLPIQKPHPPVWVPGTGSPDTIQWAAEHHYTYVAFLATVEVAEDMFTTYRQHATNEGYEARPENLGYMTCCLVADTDEKAQELGKEFMMRMSFKGPKEFMAPPGLVPVRSDGRTFAPGAQRSATRDAAKPLDSMSYEECQDAYHIIVGSPETVTRKLRYLEDRLGIGSVLFEANGGFLSHKDVMRSIELIGSEVIPALKG